MTDRQDDPRDTRESAPTTEHPHAEQPDPEASSDGDTSWTDDPASGVDPDEDRSVEAVVERDTRRPMRPVRRAV
ncbi:MAG: hypothetical protein U0R68_06540 [Candidatus Nanopelagicales bacterium]